MRRRWIILAVAVLLAAAYCCAFTGTPLFGRRLALKDASVSSIALQFASSNPREITASNACAEVLKTMRQARDGGPIHACPCLGTLIIHYADGTTNRFDLLPGHHFNRLDLVDMSGSGLYSISAGRMFGTLHHVGLLNENR